jgi:predicted nuclease of predicted toxin-antitoxin system
MKLKLDENLSRHLKVVLSRLNHDVVTVADQGLLSRTDLEIADEVKREGRMLLTLDLEFGDLRKYPPGQHPGIFLFRPRSLGPLAVNRFIEEFIRETDMSLFEGCVVVIDPSKIRVRRPPLDTESDEWVELPI